MKMSREEARKMDHAGQEKHLLGKIGSKVKFVYPIDDKVQKMVGFLKDRVVCRSSDDGHVVYWNAIDKVRFDGDDRIWIRLTYYRYLRWKEEVSRKLLVHLGETVPQSRQRWVFAGQTSLCEPVENVVKLLRKAQEKNWL